MVATLNDFTHYKTRKNMKIPARNEKVACSSQVTSSIKTPGFSEKTAVFITFGGNLKDPENGLAFI